MATIAGVIKPVHPSSKPTVSSRPIFPGLIISDVHLPPRPQNIESSNHSQRTHQPHQHHQQRHHHTSCSDPKPNDLSRYHQRQPTRAHALRASHAQPATKPYPNLNPATTTLSTTTISTKQQPTAIIITIKPIIKPTHPAGSTAFHPIYPIKPSPSTYPNSNTHQYPGGTNIIIITSTNRSRTTTHRRQCIHLGSQHREPHQPSTIKNQP